jgi:diaminopimelate epimerase
MDNSVMRIKFTKMQGAGNDFVVLDETAGQLGLTGAHYRLLADRHFGVGADQILTVRPSVAADIDFQYIIHNADGAEVEQCGNGARCFARFVRDRGLCSKDTIRVQTLGGVIEPRLLPDGRVAVNMGQPVFDLAAIPFDGGAVPPVGRGAWQQWPLELVPGVSSSTVLAAVLSMGNPHAVLLVDDADAAPVQTQGLQVQGHRAFSRGVNVGFMQIVDRDRIRLRVFERGAGETLACGSGACAAVVAGIRLGLLGDSVEVQTRGGKLGISWRGAGTSILMTGQATTVFHGEIDLPEHL